jgi:4-alpha-glucanotransferase
MATMDDLTAAAERWAIEPGFYDHFGRWHTTTANGFSRLIAALSVANEPAHAVPPVEPLRAYQGDDKRHWGLAVQLYAVRSRRNWGHGDFTDLALLVTLAARRGASSIGLNPLHALFAGDASPYGPNSRLFLNALYIDVEAIPEFPGLSAVGLAAEVDVLRASEMVDYAGVARVKLAGLRAAHVRFRSAATRERCADFEAFRKEQGEALLRFACFEVLRARYASAPWPEWPQPWRNPSPADLKSLRAADSEACEFHEFVQWVADRQLAACKEFAHQHGMPIGLFIDLAVGVDPNGADAWSQQDLVLTAVSIGAPLDDFNPEGQNWGLAPFNPHALPRDDFAPMRRLLGAAMRHAGAIRLDHVFGLKRMFMIPRGCAAEDGAYVRFPFESLLRVVAEESHRFRCIVIGEDLGTVPDGFREALALWGFWSYRVMLFERDGDGRFRPPDAYPAEALATFDTHDMATFQGWLQGYDMRVRQAIGFTPGETEDAREHSRQALQAALAVRSPDARLGDFAAIAGFLAATPSRLVVVSIEDVLGVLDQVNIPGTIDEHPNWRRKLPIMLEDFESHDGLQRVAQTFADAGRASRAP